MVIRQGDVWWADLPGPAGSEPGYRRPVIVVQCDDFNQSSIRTVVCVAVTTNLDRLEAPGNVELPAGVTGLPRDSVANVSQILTADRQMLDQLVGFLPSSLLDAVLDGIDILLGRRS